MLAHRSSHCLLAWEAVVAQALVVEAVVEMGCHRAKEQQQLGPWEQLGRRVHRTETAVVGRTRHLSRCTWS